MTRFYAIVACIAVAAVSSLAGDCALAQDNPSSSASSPGAGYLERYKIMVGHVGDCGIGVQTLLDKWEAAAPSDINMMLGRFNYFIAKSSRDTLVKKTSRSYLGLKPLLNMKDSSGTVWYYFNEPLYDDALFSEGLKWIGKAITADDTRLEFQIARAGVLSSYEKDSPDVALDFIIQIIDSKFSGRKQWRYEGKDVDAETFDALIQDFCVNYYRTAAPSTYEAFRTISERMLKYEKNCVTFLDNLGSYWLVVKKNLSKAKKYYTQALKQNPEDPTAKKNLEILHRMELAAKAGKKK